MSHVDNGGWIEGSFVFEWDEVKTKLTVNVGIIEAIRKIVSDELRSEWNDTHVLRERSFHAHDRRSNSIEHLPCVDRLSLTVFVGDVELVDDVLFMVNVVVGIHANGFNTIGILGKEHKDKALNVKVIEDFNVIAAVDAKFTVSPFGGKVDVGKLVDKITNASDGLVSDLNETNIESVLGAFIVFGADMRKGVNVDLNVFSKVGFLLALFKSSEFGNILAMVAGCVKTFLCGESGKTTLRSRNDMRSGHWCIDFGLTGISTGNGTEEIGSSAITFSSTSLLNKLGVGRVECRISEAVDGCFIDPTNARIRATNSSACRIAVA